MQAAYQRVASEKRPWWRLHQGRKYHWGRADAQLFLTGPDIPLAPRAAAGSVAYLDRTETPTVGRVDAPLHHVAVAIVGVGIVVGIIGIIIIVVAVIGVGSIAEYAHSKSAAVVKPVVVEAIAAETVTLETS